MFQIENSVTLITGGASKLGLAIARELLLEKAKGVAIADNCATGETLVKNILEDFWPDKVIFIRTDVTDPEQLRGAFDITVNVFQQLDVVFNNAGMVNELDWKNSILVNLNAAVRGTKLAVEEYLPRYSRQLNPIVVNSAFTVSSLIYDQSPVYSAAKTAIVAFTTSFGPAFDVYKVRVISFSLGTVKGHGRSEEELRLSPESFQSLLIKLYSENLKSFAKHIVSLLPHAPSGSKWKVNSTNVIQRY